MVGGRFSGVFIFLMGDFSAGGGEGCRFLGGRYRFLQGVGVFKEVQRGVSQGCI